MTVEKISRATREQAKNLVANLIIAGYQKNSDIVDAFCRANEAWAGLFTTKQIERMVGAVNSDFAKAAQADRQMMFGLVHSRYEFLWRKAIKNGDMREARGVLKDMANMFGLNAPTRHEVTGELKHSDGNNQEMMKIVKDDPDAVEAIRYLTDIKTASENPAPKQIN